MCVCACVLVCLCACVITGWCSHSHTSHNLKFWDQDLCTHLRKNPKLFKVRDSVGGGSRFEYMLTQEGVGKTVGGEVAIPGALWEKIGGGGGEEEERKRGFEEAGAMRANVVTPMEEVGEVEAPVDRIREVRLQVS